MILLDTCALLWLASDQSRLSPDAKRAIEKNSNALFISAITAFEIAVKCRAKKLTLPLPVEQWIPETLAFHGIGEIAVTSALAVASVQLPPLHNDPCDRIILATAQMNGMKITTPDALISQYPSAPVIW